MKVKKGNWFSMTRYLFIVFIAVFGVLSFSGCGGGGDEGGNGGGGDGGAPTIPDTLNYTVTPNTGF